jgi:hypothetical protein
MGLFWWLFLPHPYKWLPFREATPIADGLMYGLAAMLIYHLVFLGKELKFYWFYVIALGGSGVFTFDYGRWPMLLEVALLIGAAIGLTLTYRRVVVANSLTQAVVQVLIVLILTDYFMAYVRWMMGI